MSAAKAPCLCCDGDRWIYMDLGGGDSEPWGCPVCKATGFGPSWFHTDRDEDSEYYRWDDGVEYEWANERWVRGEDEVMPAECMSCDRPLTERTGVPVCARCERMLTAPTWDMDDPLEAAIWQICDDLRCDGWVLEDDPHTIPPPDAMFPSTLRHHLRPLMQDWKRYRINALRAELARLEERDR